MRRIRIPLWVVEKLRPPLRTPPQVCIVRTSLDFLKVRECSSVKRSLGRGEWQPMGVEEDLPTASARVTVRPCTVPGYGMGHRGATRAT